MSRRGRLDLWRWAAGLVLAAIGTAACGAKVDSAVSTTTSIPTTTTTVDPGRLPQSRALPESSTPQFQAEMAALWSGIVHGSAGPAMAAFFPESAYVQVKTVANPASDWQHRLVGEFNLDLAAAHRILGPDPSSATLQTVNVPSRYAHWVPPGVCDNRVGYYEVANSRLVYVEHGVVRSIGIASLISWRGVWYVVHLGAIVRAGSGGQVDDPEKGPGSSAPSTSC